MLEKYWDWRKKDFFIRYIENIAIIKEEGRLNQKKGRLFLVKELSNWGAQSSQKIIRWNRVLKEKS